jgi:hypothetical protein
VRDHVREILQDEDETSAGVVDLVLEFVRRIERIDINDDAASQQNPENQSRIGCEIGRHDRDALALFQPARLQPGSDGLRGAAEFRVG